MVPSHKVGGAHPPTENTRSTALKHLRKFDRSEQKLLILIWPARLTPQTRPSFPVSDKSYFCQLSPVLSSRFYWGHHTHCERSQNRPELTAVSRSASTPFCLGQHTERENVLRTAAKLWNSGWDRIMGIGDQTNRKPG